MEWRMEITDPWEGGEGIKEKAERVIREWERRRGGMGKEEEVEERAEEEEELIEDV